MKSIWELSVLFMELFCKSIIISKYKDLNIRERNPPLCSDDFSECSLNFGFRRFGHSYNHHCSFLNFPERCRNWSFNIQIIERNEQVF